MLCSDAWRRCGALSVLIAALAIAGCGGGTGPFAHPPGDGAPLIEPLADSGGIVVRGVSGPAEPVAHALQAAMVEALAAHEIPAATSGGNRRSRFLQGLATVEPRPDGIVRLAIAWNLTDGAGRPIGNHPVTREAPRARWESGDPALMSALAEAAAPAIAAMIQDPVPADADRARHLPLHVYSVAGVSEIDGLALRRAMEEALRQRDYAIATDLSESALIVAGSVALGPPDRGWRPIEVVWTVLDGAGRELGRLSQENRIPAGEGAPPLAAAAHDIAEAAAGGVIDLLKRLPPAAVKGAARAD